MEVLLLLLVIDIDLLPLWNSLKISAKLLAIGNRLRLKATVQGNRFEFWEQVVGIRDDFSSLASKWLAEKVVSGADYQINMLILILLTILK